jgi:hypothetical protein
MGACDLEQLHPGTCRTPSLGVSGLFLKGSDKVKS